MKKSIFLSIFTSMIILFNTTLIHAQETEYKFSAIDLIVSVTDELNVLTRGVSQSHPALEILDAEAIEIQNSFIQNHVYLSTFPDDLSFEITISATDTNSSNAVNFNLLSDDDFTEYFNRLNEEYAKAEYEELISTDIYENETTKYIHTKSFSTLNDSSVYISKYYTVMNGYNYNFTLQTNNLEIDDELEQKLISIIDTAQYTEVESSLTESGQFNEFVEMITGFGLTVLILVVILFLMIRASKAK